MISTNIRHRRQQTGRRIVTSIDISYSIYVTVLRDLYDTTDTSGDGRVSLEEFVTMCDMYGVELQQEEVQDFTALSDQHGEVLSKLFNDFFIRYIQVLKTDFIAH